jgi:hypothetical protein
MIDAIPVNSISVRISAEKKVFVPSIRLWFKNIADLILF